ncbi:MAG: ABC transporter substrate-binding protein [Clostridia bacterium]|nr:ABC transporter substrate-binding protein [Clostridia bacterium]
MVVNKERKPCILIILFLIISMLLNGCQFRKKEKPAEKVFLGGISHSILYTPVYIAISQGFFAGENLDVKYNTLATNQDLINSLNDNTSQIILAGSQIPIMENRKEENPNLIIFAQLVNKDPSLLLSREKLESFSWENLRKKIIIGGIPYSTPQLILEYLLLQNDLKPNKSVDVIRNIPKEACVGAFKGGVGDFVHLLGPEAYQLVNEGKAYLALALAEEIEDIAYTTFIAKESYLQEKPEVIKRFVRALYQAQLWCNFHSPQEIARELKPFFPKLDQSLIIAVVTDYQNNGTWSLNPFTTQEALQKMQNVLITSGVIAETLPFEKLVDNSIAQKAIEEVKIPKEYLKDNEKGKSFRKKVEFSLR